MGRSGRTIRAGSLWIGYEINSGLLLWGLALTAEMAAVGLMTVAMVAGDDGAALGSAACSARAQGVGALSYLIGHGEIGGEAYPSPEPLLATECRFRRLRASWASLSWTSAVAMSTAAYWTILCVVKCTQ
jgi:hypothetical protein